MTTPVQGKVARSKSARPAKKKERRQEEKERLIYFRCQSANDEHKFLLSLVKDMTHTKKYTNNALACK